MLVGRELLKVLVPEYVLAPANVLFPVHVFASDSSDEPPPDDTMPSTYAFVVS